MTSVKSRASASSVISSPGLNAITQEQAGISKLFNGFARELGYCEGQLAGVRSECDRLKAEVDAKERWRLRTSELARARTEVRKSRIISSAPCTSLLPYTIPRLYLTLLFRHFSQSTLRHNTDLIHSLRAQLDLAESREMRIRQAFQNVTLDLARESASRREEIKMRIETMVPAPSRGAAVSSPKTQAPQGSLPASSKSAPGNATLADGQ
ncbi:hypothetical protein BDV98DRAFT_597670 [Pterulicium gracile]|uniref:Uncharacterized protein n=1 Tax=Pterulicium gracile TaxID=1884261 RepID=A0A5C3Q7Q9_9AGAR|nr:hypothetical protein BDV98DRAFT_597670 [Pterula gracilis]